MPQVKKEHVHDLILDGARTLFEDRGYAGTTMKDIAGAAGVSASTIYVYFASKLDILFAIFSPWQNHRLDALERRLEATDDPREKLREILKGLWDVIPAEDNGFAHNLMQALTTITPEDRYDRAMLLAAEERITQMMRAALPPSRHHILERGALAHVLYMAYDGFVMNYRLIGRSRRLDLCVELMVDMLLGEVGPEDRLRPGPKVD